VRGRVVDRDGGAPVNVAQVSVVGQRVGASTNATGEFIIRGVAPGTLTIRVARIGYSPTSQTVTVAQDATVTLTLTLARAAAQLEQVVTTASGERTRREYGNVVAVIAADSIKKTQPVTTVNELLQARTPGLQVIQGSGQTGASSSIRIRGQSSLSLTNEPLIIVDGVRYDNSPVSGNFSTQRVNRFSDFNPEEIESVEVLKGPSAASLYGTAAANGVIVIKTKRGRASARPQWTLFGEGGLVQQPAEWETNWRSWGRNSTRRGSRSAGPSSVGSPPRPTASARSTASPASTRSRTGRAPTWRTGRAATWACRSRAEASSCATSSPSRGRTRRAPTRCPTRRSRA
jgi:TonB-dependent SusC/RagA subfamily outer membrane receptor